MQSKTTISGHAVHPMLVLLPVVSYVTALGAFVSFAVTHAVVWWEVALWANVVGVVTALLAAIPGAIDLFGLIPRSHTARLVGLVHMSLSLAAVSAFAANLIVQQGAWTQMPPHIHAMFQHAHIVKPDVTLALFLSGAGVVLTLVTGFFGSALMSKHRIGARDLRDETVTSRPSGSYASISRPSR